MDIKTVSREIYITESHLERLIKNTLAAFAVAIMKKEKKRKPDLRVIAAQKLRGDGWGRSVSQELFRKRTDALRDLCVERLVALQARETASATQAAHA